MKMRNVVNNTTSIVLNILALSYCLTISSCFAETSPNDTINEAVVAKPRQMLIEHAFKLRIDDVRKFIIQCADINMPYKKEGGKVFYDMYTRSKPMCIDSWTPLMAVACSNKYPDMKTEILYDDKFDASVKKRIDSLKPESIIERDNLRVDIAKLLVAAGADINAVDTKGATPLYMAIENKHIPLAKYLIDLGANVNTKTGIYIDGTSDNTPLHKAVAMPEIVKMLLDHGANINEKNSDGLTALHYAVIAEDVNTVDVLLKANAKRDEKDKAGKIPIDYIILDIDDNPIGKSKIIFDLLKK